MTSYSKFCFKYFGDLIKPFRKYFIDVKADLRIAGLNFTLDEYLSMAFFTSLLTFLLEIIVMSFIFGLFFNPFVSVSLSTTLAFMLSGIVFFIFYSYPRLLSKKKAEDIDKVLPFASSYLSALAAGKSLPLYLFTTISRFKEFGEVAKTAGKIARNISIFGMTSSEAIKKEAIETPSKDFRDLLWGIHTTITTGTDIRSFLREKTEYLMGEYRRKIRRFSQELSMYIEIYLTVVIAGSIMFIVLTSVMAGAGFDVLTIQSFIIFILLPFVSIAFMLLIKSRSPLG
jgi:flagellar protein FlaJ